MINRQKRVMAINDISCFGKCSLTVALPILSCAGLETCPLPTALLSTHTGGFEGFTFKNLNSDLIEISNHWKKLDIKFDAIYSGYLASSEQIEHIGAIIDAFKGENTLVLIDPVMGDNGRLYAGFDKKFAEKMRMFCKKADIIVPNITESSYLLDIPFKESYNLQDIRLMFSDFSKKEIGRAVITGIPLSNGNLGCAFEIDGEVEILENKKIDGMYHGTGDVFASAFLAAFMKNNDLYKAVEFAQRYVYKCIIHTKKRCGISHYGIDFECLSDYFGNELSKL